MAGKNIKPYVIFISLLFLFSAVTGYMGAEIYPREAREIVHETTQAFSFIKSLNVFLIFLFIFFNNLTKAFGVMLFGFFFGLAPLLFIIINGQIIGIFVSVYVLEAGVKKVVLSLAPHGIFEIAGVILAASYGLWLGVKFYRRIFYKEPFREYFIFSLNRFFKIVLPLLAVAAFIETFVTSLIVKMFG